MNNDQIDHLLWLLEYFTVATMDAENNPDSIGDQELKKECREELKQFLLKNLK